MWGAVSRVTTHGTLSAGALGLATGVQGSSEIFTFRTSITFAVTAFVGALAALLIFIQFKTFRLATGEAA